MQDLPPCSSSLSDSPCNVASSALKSRLPLLSGAPTAVAGQQVQFHLVNASPGIAFRLTGPGGFAGFETTFDERRVTANPNVKDDVGKVALARGPVVYCIEGVDFPDADIFKIKLPAGADLDYSYEKKLLGGVGVLHGEAVCGFDKCGFKAVPYYSWANRAPGAMRVWLPEA